MVAGTHWAVHLVESESPRFSETLFQKLREEPRKGPSDEVWLLSPLPSPHAPLHEFCTQRRVQSPGSRQSYGTQISAFHSYTLI